MSKFTIYCDSLTEGMWFKNLSSYFDSLTPDDFEIIGKRGTNPPVIEQLISYDRPDIILLHNNIPVLVIEKTSEVPTGHNVGQRFARLVKGIEEGILTIFFFPFDAMKHGEYAGVCNLNIRLIKASQKMESIHGTPLLAVNWIVDEDYELITDGSEDTRMKEILDDFIKSGFNNDCKEVKEQLNNMKEEYNRRLTINPSYGEFPNSVQKISTEQFLNSIGVQAANTAPIEFKNRPYTYIYKIGMNPKSCKRQDPYTGTQFIYDYIACRTGIHVSNKENNLVLSFPKLSSDIWFKNNPNNPNTKSCNWYLTANALLFNDSIYYNPLK